MLKYFASIPIVLTFLASLYGGFTYINKLTNQINDSTKEIMMLRKDIENIHQIYSDKTSRNANNYTEAKQNLTQEMANFSAWIGRIEGVVNALRDGSYKMSSQAEVQALEELVRNNSDAVRQFKYDIKEIERVASGGY